MIFGNIVMECPAWITIFSWISFVLYTGKVSCEGTCVRQPCSGHPDLTCKSSLIMISDVTDEQTSQRNQTVLDDVKEQCMGHKLCSLDSVCPSDSGLVVHYMCVDGDQLDSKSCPQQSEVTSKYGHIQSVHYPKKMKRPGKSREYLCHWKIRPPDGHQVVINILDIVTRGSNENCDAGLVISGNSCEGKDRMCASRILCGIEADRKLVRCGNVDIKLRKSNIVYPLRFWLFFQVYPIGKNPDGNSSLPCLVNDVNSQSIATNATGILPEHLKKANITDILIILLAVISSISIVLLVILIVFCLRWRTLQFQRSEPLYNYQDLSPGLQAHYEYISSLEPEENKNRPELADGYFEVADAVPIQERGATPTSPAYAEVEQVAYFRKLALSNESLPSRANSPNNAYSSVSPNTENANPSQDSAVGQDGIKANERPNSEPGSRDSTFADVSLKSTGGRPKKTVLNRLKGVPGLTYAERDKKLSPQGDVSPKSSTKGPSARSLLKGKATTSSTPLPIISRIFGSREDVVCRDIPDTTSEAGSEPAYEVVEEFVPLSVSKEGMKAKSKAGNDQNQTMAGQPSSGPSNDIKNKRNDTKFNCRQQETRLHTNNHAHSTTKSTSQNSQAERNAQKQQGEKKAKSNLFPNQKNNKFALTRVEGANSPKLKGATAPTSSEKKASDFASKSTMGLKNDNSAIASSVPSESSGTKNNNYKRTACKDMPRSQSIVKNGIQRFEKSSSTSNE